jgi:hypothetical protein
MEVTKLGHAHGPYQSKHVVGIDRMDGVFRAASANSQLTQSVLVWPITTTMALLSRYLLYFGVDT